MQNPKVAQKLGFLEEFDTRTILSPLNFQHKTEPQMTFQSKFDPTVVFSEDES